MNADAFFLKHSDQEWSFTDCVREFLCHETATATGCPDQGYSLSASWLQRAVRLNYVTTIQITPHYVWYSSKSLSLRNISLAFIPRLSIL